MRASSSVGKHRENIIMLNGASQGEKWHRECGRAVFVRPSELCSSACKQPFKSAPPPHRMDEIMDHSKGRGGGVAFPEEVVFLITF